MKQRPEGRIRRSGVLYLREILQRLDRTDETRAAHRRAIELDGELAAARLAYGRTLIAQGLRAEADAKLERAIDLSPMTVWADHPFLRDPPRFNAIACWSVVLPGQGRHVPHIHPAAWLSGVYYSELPSAVEKKDPTEGWIEFGTLPEIFVLTEKTPATNVMYPS